MLYRRLGKTELSISCIGLGGIGLINEDCRDYSQALEGGVNFIDTAWIYQDSEKKDRVCPGEITKGLYCGHKDHVPGL